MKTLFYSFVLLFLVGVNTLQAQVATFTISVVASPPDAATTTGSGTYTLGATINFSAIAKPGYVFLRWADNDAVGESRTSLVVANQVYRALFEKIIDVPITSSPIWNPFVDLKDNWICNDGTGTFLSVAPADNIKWYANGVHLADKDYSTEIRVSPSVDTEYSVSVKNTLYYKTPIENISSIAIGDIITNDNVLVKPANWAMAVVGGQTAKGIVYYVNTNDVRIMSIDQLSRGVAWGHDDVDLSSLPNGDSNDMNGESNTNAIVTEQPEYLTQWFSAAKLSQLSGTSWYLPAIRELRHITENINVINSTLNKIAGANQFNGRYWSSTENSSGTAYMIYSAGLYVADYKHVESFVRPCTRITDISTIYSEPIGTFYAQGTGRKTIFVYPSASITLVSAASTKTQTVQLGASIVPIIYKMVSPHTLNLPTIAGLNIRHSNDSIIITGTPTTVGENEYTIVMNGCNRVETKFTIQVNSLPQVFDIIGSSSVCSNSTDNVYSTSTTEPGTTYVWTIPVGWIITAGENTNSIRTTIGSAGGVITVTPRSSAGVLGNTKTLNVSVVGPTPATITLVPEDSDRHTQVICEGRIMTPIVYKVANSNDIILPEVPGVTITKSNDSIFISGRPTTVGEHEYTIRAVSCISAEATFRITVLNTPVIPEISGPTTVCLATRSAIYSLPEDSYNTYTWEIPQDWFFLSGQGTNKIEIFSQGNVEGNIKVTPKNYCRISGQPKTLAVRFNDQRVPSSPVISHNTSSVCGNSTGNVYSVVNVPGVTYTWDLAEDWSVESGQGTNRITAKAGNLNSSIRVKVTPSTEACGKGFVEYFPITVTRTLGETPPIQGATAVCANSTNNIYSVSTELGATYTHTWTVPTGWTIVSEGTEFTDLGNVRYIKVNAGTASGDITVRRSNSCFTGTTSTFPVTVKQLPVQPSMITGATSVCSSSTTTYSVTNVSDVTYTWIVPMGWTIISGQNTNSITVIAGTSGGNMTVIPNNSCGAGVSRTMAVAINNVVPEQPSVISGSTSVCNNSIDNIYSITNVAGITYTWTVPTGWSIMAGQNTNSINVTAGNTAGGNITVTPSNGCTAGTSRVLEVTLNGNQLPAQPSIITGVSSICNNSTGNAYSVTNVAGIDYKWVLSSTDWTITSGQNTNRITVNAGTSANTLIIVEPSNICGSGIPRVFTVTTAGIRIPETPSIVGSPLVCSNTTDNIYSVPNVDGTAYTWAVPAGWSITAGQNTNTIKVAAGNSAGSVKVVVSNACSIGTGTFAVSTAGATVPTQPSIIGEALICPNSVNIYQVNNVVGETYTWTVPTGWSIYLGQNENTIAVQSNGVGGNITVTPKNSCGSGAPKTLAVVTNETLIPSQPTAILGTTSVCPNTTNTYSVDKVAEVNYIWTVPTGWSIIDDGFATNTVRVIAGTTNGNITVKNMNACGTGAVQSVGVVAIPSNTITLVSGDKDQTTIVNNPLTTITYNTTGATGVTITGLPAGVSGSWTNNKVTISGTSTETGTYTYIATLTGGCGDLSVSGTIEVLANVFTLAFNPLGGRMNAEAEFKAVNYNETIETLPTVEKTGYAFMGWKISSDVISNKMIWKYTDNQMAYVELKPINYTIVYNENKPANVIQEVTGTTPSTVCTYDQPTNLQPNGFTLLGWKFIGWAKTPNATVPDYMPETTVQNLSDINEGTVVLYALWETVASVITFDIATNGGTGVQKEVVATYNNEMPEITTNPTKTGYTFAGYFDAVQGGTQYYDETLKPMRTWDKITNTILYAQFISVTPVTLTLLSDNSTLKQKLCIYTPITEIVYLVTGTKKYQLNNFPDGITAAWKDDNLIISGISSTAGEFNATLTVGQEDSSIDIYLSVKPESEVTLFSDFDSDNQNVTLPNAIKNIEYSITNTDGVDFINIPTWLTYNFVDNQLTLQGEPQKQGIYNYKFQLMNSCSNEIYSGTITAVSLQNVPLVVTPNGDGINDVLEMPIAAQYPNNELIIYDRKGTMIYQQKNYNNDFDGYSLINGVYIYIFKYVDENNKEKTFTNSLTITR